MSNYILIKFLTCMIVFITKPFNHNYLVSRNFSIGCVHIN